MPVMGQGQMLCISGQWHGLYNAAEIGELLLEVAHEIEMTPISGPHYFDTELGPEAILIIAESHLIFHSITPDPPICTIDVFSCASFDQDTCQSLLVEALDMTVTDSQVLERKLPGVKAE